jgi:hypothetical protein
MFSRMLAGTTGGSGVGVGDPDAAGPGEAVGLTAALGVEPEYGPAGGVPPHPASSATAAAAAASAAMRGIGMHHYGASGVSYDTRR